jgi:hypothetical protein
MVDRIVEMREDIVIVALNRMLTSLRAPHDRFVDPPIGKPEAKQNAAEERIDIQGCRNQEHQRQ